MAIRSNAKSISFGNVVIIQLDVNVGAGQRKKKRVSRFDRGSDTESPAEESAVDNTGAIMPYQDPTEFTHYLTNILDAEPSPQSWPTRCRHPPPPPPSHLNLPPSSIHSGLQCCNVVRNSEVTMQTTQRFVFIPRGALLLNLVSDDAHTDPLLHNDINQVGSRSRWILKTATLQTKCAWRSEGCELCIHRNEPSDNTQGWLIQHFADACNSSCKQSDGEAPEYGPAIPFCLIQTYKDNILMRMKQKSGKERGLILSCPS